MTLIKCRLSKFFFYILLLEKDKQGFWIRFSSFLSPELKILIYFFRYLISGKKLPYAVQWIQEQFDIDFSQKPQIPDLPTTFPKSQLPKNIEEELEKISLISIDGMDRLIRAHGQTLHDVYYLRSNSFPRIPDVVIWPTSHEEVSYFLQTVICFCLILTWLKKIFKDSFMRFIYGDGVKLNGNLTFNCVARKHLIHFCCQLAV